MSRTDYEAVVSIELPVATEDEYEEVEFTIGLECTEPYRPGYFDPRWGGEPPSGPEFDMTFITREVPDGKPLDLTWEQFEAMVGEEQADKLFEDACIQAAENGDF